MGRHALFVKPVKPFAGLLPEVGVTPSLGGLHMIWGMRGQTEVQVGCRIETVQSCVESPADVYLTSPEGELFLRKGDRRIGIREGLD